MSVLIILAIYILGLLLLLAAFIVICYFEIMNKINNVAFIDKDRHDYCLRKSMLGSVYGNIDTDSSYPVNIANTDNKEDINNEKED